MSYMYGNPVAPGQPQSNALILPPVQPPASHLSPVGSGLTTYPPGFQSTPHYHGSNAHPGSRMTSVPIYEPVGPPATGYPFVQPGSQPFVQPNFQSISPPYAQPQTLYPAFIVGPAGQPTTQQFVQPPFQSVGGQGAGMASVMGMGQQGPTVIYRMV